MTLRISGLFPLWRVVCGISRTTGLFSLFRKMLTFGSFPSLRDIGVYVWLSLWKLGLYLLPQVIREFCFWCPARSLRSIPVLGICRFHKPPGLSLYLRVILYSFGWASIVSGLSPRSRGIWCAPLVNSLGPYGLLRLALWVYSCSGRKLLLDGTAQWAAFRVGLFLSVFSSQTSLVYSRFSGWFLLGWTCGVGLWVYSHCCGKCVFRCRFST